ncbi:MAG: hypothetical protein HYY10_03100 [Candidatus Liptonbacteria bacterium]|nr:hypothetical protein [Candidatus Liptonbacteria bacterium]
MESRLQILFARARNWCITNKQEIGFAVIIFLVATMSFGLGYLANREYTHAPIVIEQYATSTAQ